MKKAFAWVGLVVVCYLFFLILYLPMAWLWPQLPLPRQVGASGISGSLWQGEIARLTIEDIELQAVRWEWQPASLLGGRLEAAVRLGGADSPLRGKGIAGISFDGAYLETTDLAAPVAWVKTQLRQPIPAQLDGRVSLHISEYRYGTPWCASLDGTLSWREAGIRSVLGAVDLQQVNAELGCNDGSLTAQVQQQSPALELRGDGSLDRNGRYQFSGTLKAGAALPGSLAENLKYIGRPDPQGRYRLSYSGRL